MSTTSTLTGSAGTEYPGYRFYRKEGDWENWKEKFKVRASIKGYDGILSGTDVVPKTHGTDGQKLTKSSAAEQAIAETNLKGFGYLIPSIDCSSAAGRVAFAIIKNTKTVNTLSPNFGFVPRLRIQHTLDHTIRFERFDTRLPLRKQFKSCLPAANVNRLNEVVATDTYFSDTPALDNGIIGHGGTKMVQLSCGSFAAIYPMLRENNIAGTLEDFICFYGTPTVLFSDNDKSQIGGAVRKSYTFMLFRTSNVNLTINIRTMQNVESKTLKN
jgi:hypothetical protein